MCPPDSKIKFSVLYVHLRSCIIILSVILLRGEGLGGGGTHVGETMRLTGEGAKEGKRIWR